MLYEVLSRLIAQGRTAGLRDKLAVFYSVDALTGSQYLVLLGRLKEAEAVPEVLPEESATSAERGAEG